MGMWTIPESGDKDCKFSEEEITDFIELLADGVVKRGMSVPAVMTLEMVKPLSFIGYSTLVIFAPILEIIIDPVKMEKLQAITADRKRVEQLMLAIEGLEKSKKDIKEGESRE